MDIQQLWDKALKDTEIVRTRALDLPTYEATALPYIFLAESGLNAGDTVVRKGEVVIERPALILPMAQFQGFKVGQDMQISDDSHGRPENLYARAPHHPLSLGAHQSSYFS